jgi:intracellular sulfur oxidation DsrE/DsrF family protein
MKRTIILALLFLPFTLAAQQKSASRSDVLKAKESTLIYPFLKGSTNTGVLPVDQPSFPFAFKGTVKLSFDLTQPTTNPTNGDINQGLEEITRQLNLQVAAGARKLDAIVIFHAGAAQFMTNNETYRKKFNMDNPNLPLMQQLMDKGVQFVVCGQTLELRDMKMEQFPDGIKRAYSARSALADLQSRGYVMVAVAGEH